MKNTNADTVSGRPKNKAQRILTILERAGRLNISYYLLKNGLLTRTTELKFSSKDFQAINSVDPQFLATDRGQQLFLEQETKDIESLLIEAGIL